MGNQKSFGFGIVGLGVIAENHVNSIKAISGCSFVAGFHPVPGRAAEFCAKHGGKAYDNLSAFMADKNIDIVAIATPSGLHLESAVAAAKAGKHIICEKPLEITIERCGVMIAEANANKVKLGTIFQSRYFEASAVIRKAISEGRLGKIALADAQIKWYRSQEYYDSGKWRGTLQYDGGGVLMNQGIHAIDLLQWFMGPVSEVMSYTATLAHQRIEVEDTAAAVLKFSNGAIGVIQGSTCAYPGFLKKIEICGSLGSIVMEEENILTWKFTEEKPEDEGIRKRFSPSGQTKGGASDPKAIGALSHKKVFEAFVNSLREDKQPDIDGTEGKKSVEIIEAIYRSAKNRGPVTLPLST